ncbi:MAG: hypothetical protein ACFCVG_05955 [Kineosporiaceae bacterium]
MIGTAPVDVDGRRFNRAFTWSPLSGVEWWRRKTWLPDEPPVFEASWVIGPDGDVLARTTSDEPIATVDIDLDHADRARRTYPRYALWTRRWERWGPVTQSAE